jgi:transcriptional regulator with XRE-family HTH domain
LPQLSPIVQHPPAALEQALQRLGRNIRTARLRRRWRLEDVAERMGVSRFTVADVERGKPGTSIAAYLGALWVLGLLDQLEAVADPDRDGEGKALEAGSTEFVTAGRFSQSRDPKGQPVGTFVYGRRYRERADAVELDPVQLRLRQGPFLSLPTSRCPSVD